LPPEGQQVEEWAMTTAFRDFLREQEAKHQAEVRAGKATVEEWQQAVQDLFAQMRAWLAESDPDGKIIHIEEGKHEVTEPGLRRYEIPRLDLHAFGKWVGIIPKARKTVGTATPPQRSAPERAAGRVDMTNELRRYVLYRFREDDRDVWVIDDLNSGPKPLDQEAFERALMSYFR
jgi:hypothetical protein